MVAYRIAPKFGVRDGVLSSKQRMLPLEGQKRATSGAAAVGKGFEERVGNPSRTKSRRDIEIEAKNAEILSKLGLDELEDDGTTKKEQKR